MIRFVNWIITLLLVFSCSNNSSNGVQNRTKKFRHWQESSDKLKILSTTAMIDDLVKQVGGNHVATLTLIEGELDPHSYQLVKGDDEKFALANIIFSNGLGLEHGPSLQKHLHSNPKVVSLGNLIQKHHNPLILHYNGQLDPHIWMDISIWSKGVPFIVEALSNRDPTHASEYRSNGEKLMQSLHQKHEQIIEILAKIPESRRYLVTSHDAFNYFVRAYLATDKERQANDWQKRFAAPEGLAPESQLSTTDIKNIIDHVAKYKVEVLFPESNVSKDSIKKIVSAGNEIGLQLRIAADPLYGDAMGDPNFAENTYENMILHNAHILEKWWK